MPSGVFTIMNEALGVPTLDPTAQFIPSMYGGMDYSQTGPSSAWVRAQGRPQMASRVQDDRNMAGRAGMLPAIRQAAYLTGTSNDEQLARFRTLLNMADAGAGASPGGTGWARPAEMPNLGNEDGSGRGVSYDLNTGAVQVAKPTPRPKDRAQPGQESQWVTGRNDAAQRWMDLLSRGGY